MRIPAAQQKWTAPAARLEGERTLARMAAVKRAIDEPPAVKIKVATIEERLADLERDIRAPVADLPKIVPAGGGGKRMVAKVLARDFPSLAAVGDMTFGTAAEADIIDFATAAQGLKADSALQSAAIGVTVQGYSATLAGTTASFTIAKDTKLSGIATGATANSSDATLLARANHTGTQNADTLTDGTTNKAFLATERTKLSAGPVRNLLPR